MRMISSSKTNLDRNTETHRCPS